MKAFGHVSLCAVAIAMVTPAHAAENTAEEQTAQASEGTGLAEIVVTATKRAENLQNVPVAVSAIPASTL